MPVCGLAKSLNGSAFITQPLCAINNLPADSNIDASILAKDVKGMTTSPLVKYRLNNGYCLEISLTFGPSACTRSYRIPVGCERKLKAIKITDYIGTAPSIGRNKNTQNI